MRASRHHVIPIHPLYAYILAMQILRNVVIIHIINSWIQPTDLANNWQLFTLFPHLLDQLDLQRLDVPAVKEYLYVYQQRGTVPSNQNHDACTPTSSPAPARGATLSGSRPRLFWKFLVVFSDFAVCGTQIYNNFFLRRKEKGKASHEP